MTEGTAHSQEPEEEEGKAVDTISPGRLGYVLAAICAVLTTAIIATTIVLVLPHARDKSTRFLVPGEAELNLSEAGAYGVYHEYESAYEGRVFSTEHNELSDLVCTLTDTQTGNHITLHKPRGWATYKRGQRHGSLLLKFDVKRPGRYVFKTHYSVAPDRGQVVFAVDKDQVVEMTLTIILGCGAGMLLGFLAIGLAIVTAVRRKMTTKVAR